MDMDPRAADLIARLGLIRHPEGGYYREVYRSQSRVRRIADRAERGALTTIYFLLPGGEVSRWHRVASDEVWHFYEGDPLQLLTADAGFERVTRHELGSVARHMHSVHTVPANVWQAARSQGAFTLAGCTVGPGFDFADFEMLRQRSGDVEIVKRRHPDAVGYI
jgi:predicted cupin superfamily sugar epimerase